MVILKVKYIFIISKTKLSFLEWELTGAECWTECSNNGGSCSHCGQNGFCCRNWDGDSESGVPAANGNCPPNAIQAALTDRHQCVAPKQGL